MRAHRLFGAGNNPLAAANRQVLSGFFKPPIWLEAVRRVPPIVQLSAPHPGKIVFPEDRLYSKLYLRLPILIDEPLYLTDAHSDTLGSRIARKWADAIDNQKMSEDDAWKVVIEDPTIQATLKDFTARVESANDNPITAANIQRNIHSKLEHMTLIRRSMGKASRSHSPLTRYRSEVAQALDLRSVLDAQSRSVYETANETRAAQHRQLDKNNDIDEITSPDRAELSIFEGHWVVPDMSETHQLRFIKGPAYQELDELYGIKSLSRVAASDLVQRATVAVDYPNSIALNAFEWSMSHAVVKDQATLRDFIAYALRQQVVTLKSMWLQPWKPYTNAIDRTLWRQARAVLRAKQPHMMEGQDMENKHSIVGAESAAERSADLLDEAELMDEVQEGQQEDELANLDLSWLDSETVAADESIVDGRPLVYSDLEPEFTEEDSKRHLLLLSFIDDALQRNEVREEQFIAQAREVKNVNDARRRERQKQIRIAKRVAMKRERPQQFQEDDGGD